MLSATPEGIAVDQRVSGFPTSPSDGYDTGTVGSDLVALMDALGHQRFALLGFDTGFLIAVRHYIETLASTQPPCTAASSSTARSPPPRCRPSSVRPEHSPCLSSQSVERKAAAKGPRTR